MKRSSTTITSFLIFSQKKRFLYFLKKIFLLYFQKQNFLAQDFEISGGNIPSLENKKQPTTNEFLIFWEI